MVAILHRAPPIRKLALPLLFGGVPLALAIIGGLLLGEDGSTGGINSIVERLSGSSTSGLGDLGSLAPLGFAFAAGMAATVNPCGFAMLPAYIGLYMGSGEQGEENAGTFRRLARALKVGGVVSAGFVLLFGVAGIAIAAGARVVVDAIPWVGLSIGVLLAFVGMYLVGGGKLYTGIAAQAAARIGDPGKTNVRGYFLFGLSYGIASLSCTLPIFLAVVGTSIAVSDIPTAAGQFLLYALGMGLVIMFLTLGMAVFKTAVVGILRRALPYMQPVSAGLMILAGSYIVFYWLTIGGLL